MENIKNKKHTLAAQSKSQISVLLYSSSIVHKENRGECLTWDSSRRVSNTDVTWGIG